MMKSVQTKLPPLFSLHWFTNANLCDIIPVMMPKGRNTPIAVNGAGGNGLTKAWQPTLKHIRAAQALVDPTVGTNFEDVAKVAGISRVTLNAYLKNAEFCKLVHELLPQHTDNILFLAWKVLYEKITADKDLEPVKLLFRLKKQITEVTNIKITQNISKFEQYLQVPISDAPRKRIVDTEVLEPEDAEFSEAEA